MCPVVARNARVVESVEYFEVCRSIPVYADAGPSLAVGYQVLVFIFSVIRSSYRMDFFLHTTSCFTLVVSIWRNMILFCFVFVLPC